MSLRAMATSEAVHEPISQRERQHFWQDGYVFTVGNETEVAKVALPNGTIPEWVFAPQAYQDGYTFSSARLSEDLIAFTQTLAAGRGRLLIVRIEPSPGVVGSLEVDFPLLTAAVHSSGFLFSTTNSLAENDTLLVFDVRDSANPVFHETIDLGMGSDFIPRTLSARDEDIFVSARIDTEVTQPSWYRFADDFRSVRTIQKNTDVFASSSETGKSVFYDRFLFVSGQRFGDEGPGVAVCGLRDRRHLRGHATRPTHAEKHSWRGLRRRSTSARLLRRRKRLCDGPRLRAWADGLNVRESGPASA